MHITWSEASMFSSVSFHGLDNYGEYVVSFHVDMGINVF